MIDKIKKKILTLKEPKNRLVVVFSSLERKEKFINEFKEAEEGNSHGWRDQTIEKNRTDFLVFRLQNNKLSMYRYGSYANGIECTNSETTMYLINESDLFSDVKGKKKKLEL